MKDPYAVLGVSKNATKEDIVKAYRKGAQQHHPDRNPGDQDAEARFRDIQQAYEILSDPIKKSEYDSGGSTMRFRTRTSDGFGFDGMMNDFFQNSTFRGRNVQVRLEIDLKEAYTGCNKIVLFKTKNICVNCKGSGQIAVDNCPTCEGQGFTKVNNAPFEFRTNCTTCSGSGKVNPKKCDDCNGSGALPGYKERKSELVLPMGVSNNTQVRLVGQGEESIRPGGKPGDAIVFIIIRDHSYFTRDGLDLFVDIPVSYTQLVLGCELEFYNLVDEKIVLKVPAGTQSHSKLKIRGRGMIIPSGVAGDIIVTLKVETPTKINDDYKESILALKGFEENQIDPKRQQWQKNVLKSDT